MRFREADLAFVQGAGRRRKKRSHISAGDPEVSFAQICGGILSWSFQISFPNLIQNKKRKKKETKIFPVPAGRLRLEGAGRTPASVLVVFRGEAVDRIQEALFAMGEIVRPAGQPLAARTEPTSHGHFT